MIYHNNGIRHFEYKIKNFKPYFYSVRNPKGEPDLTREGYGKHVFYDSLGGRMLNYYFKDHRMVEAYFIDSSGIKIYQHCQPANASFSYKIQGLINKEVNYPRRSLAENHHGYMLIKCIVQTNGMVSDFQIIKGIDNDCDSTFAQFFNIVKGYRHFWPGTVDNKNVVQEIVISVYFKADFVCGRDFYKTELPLRRNANPNM